MSKANIIPAEAIKDISDRMDSAIEKFKQSLMNIGGITRQQADKVYAAYDKAKVLKKDFVVGQITVKHGAFLDAEQIQHVASL